MRRMMRRKNKECISMQKKALREAVKQLKKTMKETESFNYVPISAEQLSAEQRKKKQICLMETILNILETYDGDASEKLKQRILWALERIKNIVSVDERNQILRILIKEIHVFIKNI